MTAHISRQELLDELAAGTVTLVDPNPRSYWSQEHIPGAINLSGSDVDHRAAELLPGRDAAVVVYGWNAASRDADAVADRLAALGYKDLSRYREGLQDWIRAGLPVESAAVAPPADIRLTPWHRPDGTWPAGTPQHRSACRHGRAAQHRQEAPHADL